MLTRKSISLIGALLYVGLLPVWASANQQVPRSGPQRRGASSQSFNAFRDSLMGRYNSFRSEVLDNYQKFREKVNSDYAEFLAGRWVEARSEKPLPQPEDKNKPVKPVVCEPETPKPAPKPQEGSKPDVKPTPKPKPVPDAKPAPEVKPVPEAAPLPPIPPIEQPRPAVEPEQPRKDDIPAFPDPMHSVLVSLYNTNFYLSIPTQSLSPLNSIQNQDIVKSWKELADGRMDKTLSDCLQIRKERKINDWMYLQLLQTLGKTLYPNDANRATLLTAYLYANSGYRMRLGRNGGKLMMLYASHHLIYKKPYFTLGNDKYYPMGEDCENMDICDAAFEGEQPMSLILCEEPLISEKKTQSTRLVQLTSGLKASWETNENLIEFLNTYPSSSLSDNVLTRWGMTCNMPLSSTAKEYLYHQLQDQLMGKSELQKVSMLLDFVQKGFEYKLDDEVWGCDRAFYPDEVLYYPYSDCEDRTALFTRLVRDLTGLKCAIIYYPGHLAAAVKFNEAVSGDKIRVNGTEYLICDPTYINASPGMQMPGLDSSRIQALEL